MNPQEKHGAMRDIVADRLRRRDHSVVKITKTRQYDLLIDGIVRIAIRVAYPGRYTHTVTVNGRRYSYDYRNWNFNFHRHGRWGKKYCDVFICVAKQRRGNDEIFVIPTTSISGPTLSLHGASKPYHGRYARYRNRWDLVLKLVRRQRLAA